MCEKRTRKIKKGSQVARVREARRLQRLNWLASPASSDDSNPIPNPPCPHAVEAQKTAQIRVILDLAWKTVALMQKNRIIQQKIIDLQKETSEFVASVKNNGDNNRYMQQIQLYSLAQQAQARQICEISTNIPLKLEPFD